MSACEPSQAGIASSKSCQSLGACQALGWPEGFSGVGAPMRTVRLEPWPGRWAHDRLVSTQPRGGGEGR